MDIREDHPAGKGGDDISYFVFHAAFMRGFCAEMDDGANILLDHFAQCRVVFSLVIDILSRFLSSFA